MTPIPAALFVAAAARSRANLKIERGAGLC